MKRAQKDEIRKAVRENYGKVAQSKATGCGGVPTACCGTENDSTAADIALGLGYSREEVSAVPGGANMGLGCGNPQAIASLQSGETVLDLGSGGGLDCFLAARAVGVQGRVIGVDMTPEMIRKARQNADQAGFGNIEFRLGEIENLPVADEIVDVILSNCVINLSPEKDKVFREAFRVLKPGGRLAIADIVAMAEMPDEVKQDMTLYTGCVAGAASIRELESILHRVGFREIRIKPKDESKKFIRDWVPGSRIEDSVVSATIEAMKPKA
jgi:SAM-dependent methyltransferase